MKAIKKGRKEGKKMAKSVTRKTPKLVKKAAIGAGKLESKWRKSLAQKEEMIRKLKAQLVEKEKAIKEAQKSFFDKAKESLLEWKKKAQEEVKQRAEKLAGQKDNLLERLKREMADKENLIRQGEKTLREAMDSAKKEVAAIKEKTDQTLMEWKTKAEAEYKRLKEELEKKAQPLGDKVKELEEYQKKAEKKMAELQSKAKEFVAKAVSGEEERQGLITFKGGPMTLLGAEVKVGDKAPDFKAVDNGMQLATLDSFRGKVKIISSVPSLDTPVCDMETRRFNEEAGKLPDNVVVLTVSMDLPFAQKRWCAAAGVEKVKTLSDYQSRSFGQAYGVVIKELQLLARAVFIVDDQDIVRYIEIVPEVTKEPDYDRALNAVKALL
jgi:thioredoxin-dependent peroxiredoxin